MCKKMIALCSLIIVFSLTVIPINAAPLGTWEPGDGWLYSTIDGHMGTKDSTFKYSSSSVKSKYETFVNGGITLWGTNISMTYLVNSTMGTITESLDSSGSTASCGGKSTDANGHISKYTITIYSANFNSSNKTDQGRCRTIAHEIGHAYGLGDLSNTYSSQIMYGVYSETKNVTANDKAGMKVVTHIDTHNSVSYNRAGGNTHKITCSTCGAHRMEACMYSTYHLGKRHYLNYNCICGNNASSSWFCPGNPCIFPF